MYWGLHSVYTPGRGQRMAAHGSPHQAAVLHCRHGDHAPVYEDDQCCRCDLGPGSRDITCSNQYSASRLLKTENSWDISPVCQYLEYLWNTKCVINSIFNIGNMYVCILFIFLYVCYSIRKAAYPPSHLPFAQIGYDDYMSFERMNILIYLFNLNPCFWKL